MKPDDFDMICDLLLQRSGLVLTRDKAYLVESRLLPVARKFNLKSVDELAVQVRLTRNDAMIRDIVEAMTTNETSFFRDMKPFEQFRQAVLPYMLEKRAAKRSFRIWSAASSSGQEAYSLSMTLADEKAKMAGWQWEILGTDLSKEMVERAREGVYSQFEIQRGLPITQVVKHFAQEGERWRVKPHLKQNVSFREFNLLESLRPLGTFDIVYCRNVLIYFDQPTKKRVLEAIAAQLAPDGFLYLGGAETVLGITDAFKPVDSHRGMYVKTAAEMPFKTPAPLGSAGFGLRAASA